MDVDVQLRSKNMGYWLIGKKIILCWQKTQISGVRGGKMGKKILCNLGTKIKFWKKGEGQNIIFWANIQH